MLADNFRTLAQYNRWINTRLYNCAATMETALLKKDLGAFFGSILGTFNHILVADIIWLQRIAKHPAQLASLESLRTHTRPQALNQLLHEDLASLREHRNNIDEALIAFTVELNAELLDSALQYEDMKGNPHRNKLSDLVQHLFNHQTHHRGQATTLFHQCGVDVGATDLLVMLRES